MFDMYTYGLKPLLEPIVEKYQKVTLPDAGQAVTFQLLKEWPDFKFSRPKGTADSMFSDLILAYRGWELFQVFSVENILLTIGCILTEHKIIIINDNLYQLTNAVLQFVALLFPFKWTTNTIPILPSELFVFLDSPVPYISGVTEFPEVYIIIIYLSISISFYIFVYVYISVYFFFLFIYFYFFLY